MPALVCPRCSETYAGAIGSGWLTCQRCQHRWLPSAAPLSVPTKVEAAPIALPPAPPASVAADKLKIHESDEYAPDETGAAKLRTAALTNRQTPAASADADPAAPPSVAGSDPFDPDLFERMARNAQVERNREQSDAFSAPARSSPPPALPVAAPAKISGSQSAAKERTVTSRQIACPVCGHGFPSDRPDDMPQACPQCQTSFNLARGHVVSGGAKSANGDPLLGRVLRGCLIDRKVGEGGMGSVYHARQLSLERSVAIKVLPPELARNRNFITRFEREAKSLARINHPNILHIYPQG